MKGVAALSVLGAANATNLALTWNDCGGLAKIAEVLPATVPLGTATTITGSGNSPTKVTGGNFAATVKAGWIPLASCAGPLGPAKTCTLPLGAGSLTLDAIPLPIGPGAASIGLTVDLAASLPAQLATTTTHATATNEAGQTMVCIDVFLKSGAALSNPVGGVFDDILKWVCKMMENGSTEAEAEKLICSSLKYELEVTACDKVVDLLWKEFEGKECPAGVPGESSYLAYVDHYGKTPETSREKIFNANMKLIRMQNADPKSTWVAGPNEFTDWTNEEFRAWRTSPKPPMPKMPVVDITNAKTNLDRIDWRESKGVVTPVKNQGQCGSCWAFSATETLESHFAITNNEDAPILGPQQIVSCTIVPGGGGCNGGFQTLAFNYTEHAGLTTEANYPYTAETGTCDPSKIKPAVKNKGYVALKVNDYTALMNAAQKGPTAISVAAGGLGWQFYSSGVFSGGLFGCGFEVDHAVQLVGYGKEKDGIIESGKMYWLVRNSWGSGWGEQGYIRIERFGEGKEPCGKAEDSTICGECGILFANSYPTGVTSAGGILV